MDALSMLPELDFKCTNYVNQWILGIETLVDGTMGAKDITGYDEGWTSRTVSARIFIENSLV